MPEFKDQPKNLTKKLVKVTKNAFKFRKGGEKIFNKKPEKQQQELNSNDTSEDLVEELFKEINPLGIPIGDVKEKLEEEVQELETIIKKLEQVPTDLNKQIITDTKKEILGKNWWIMKIRDFLLDKNISDLRNINPSSN